MEGLMDNRLCMIVAMCLAMTAPPALAQDLPGDVLPPDQPTTIGGVEVACTGIGQTRDEARWQAFNVRIEVSNARNEYLGAGSIRLADASGAPLLQVRCEAPWVLLKLRPGAYRVEGRVRETASTRSARFAAPATGQTRIVLQFVDVVR